MLTPGPDHPITLETAKRRWRAAFEQHVIADSDDALILREADYPPVVYFPRRDVAMEYMGRTAHRSRCPYKGEASYYTLTMDGDIAENVAWSYEEPYEAMEPIAGRVAFYADRIRVYDVDDAAVNPHRLDEVTEREEIDDIVQHTDAGDGISQGSRWPPNVSGPDGGLR
jgi:uncharacterized protein (DUF427 family)